jgi:hypothetical protein
MWMKDSVAKANWAAIDRQINSPAGFRILMWIFVVTAIAFSVVPLLRYFRGGSTHDYQQWYDTGKQVLAGGEIFFFRSGKYDFMYPPPCALFLAGASLLGQGTLILLLVAINSIAWFCSARWTALLAAGQRSVASAWLYLIPSLVVVIYIWSSYHLGQPNLVLLALMLGAFVALRTNREISAGALIGVAAAVKAFPVIAVVYLVYRGYWKAVASLVVALIFLLFVLPAPFRGFDRALRDFEKWSAGMLKYNATAVAQRPMRSYTWKNQSLVGVTNRLLRHVDADAASAPHNPVYVNFTDFKFATANVIIIAVALALGIVFVAVMPQRGTRTPESDGIEFALLLLVMLMVTPLAFGYFFSWLMLPFAIVVQRLLVGRGAVLFRWGLPALVLLALGLPFRRGAQFYGNTFFATLLLFVGLSIELRRCKQPSLQPRPAARSPLPK